MSTLKKSVISAMMMSTRVSDILYRTPLIDFNGDVSAVRWLRGGMQGTPPSSVKQATIRDFSIRYGIDTLVETGTFWGLTVRALQPHFRKIVTIELSQSLSDRANFLFRNSLNVSVLQGDSARVLPRVIDELAGPTLFWLDAHYSKGVTALGEEETPILAELRQVLGDRRFEHIILIDDAREFGSNPEYPTLSELRETAASIRADYRLDVGHDIIRLTPSE